MLFLSLLLSTSAEANEPLIPPATQALSDANMNWTNMSLQAQHAYSSDTSSWGFRESMATREVGKKIRSSVMYLRVTPDQTIETIMNSEPKLKSRLVQGAKGWKTAATYYIQNSHEVEVIGSLNIRGYLRKIIINNAANIKEQTPELHTGVLIDARGVDFEPSIFPVVTLANGEEIISAKGFSKQAAQVTTPVLYVANPADPQAVKRIGDQPSLIRAQYSDGGVLQIHPDDEKRLPNAKDLQAIVSSGKIVVVVE